MNDPLDTLLRDPRAHGDAPDPQAARTWGRQAVTRWQAEQSATTTTASRRPRLRWQDLAGIAGLAAAAAALLPMVVDLAGGLWARVPSLDGAASLDGVASLHLSAPLGALLEQPLEAPLPWLAGAAALLFLCVPQLRGFAERLLDG